MKISTKLVYVAGPYTAPTPLQREHNIRRAEETCTELWRRGIPALAVHLLDRFGCVEYEEAVAIDNVILDRCDAVLLVQGWPFSKGSRAEIERAKASGKPVFYAGDFAGVEAWAFAAEAA